MHKFRFRTVQNIIWINLALTNYLRRSSQIVADRALLFDGTVPVFSAAVLPLRIGPFDEFRFVSILRCDSAEIVCVDKIVVPHKTVYEYFLFEPITYGFLHKSWPTGHFFSMEFSQFSQQQQQQPFHCAAAVWLHLHLIPFCVLMALKLCAWIDFLCRTLYHMNIFYFEQLLTAFFTNCDWPGTSSQWNCCSFATAFRFIVIHF